MLEQEELCKNAIKKGRLKVVKRPVLIAIIGYIIGIIMGLYFNFSIALFYIPIIVIYFFKKTLKISKKEFKLISLKRYFRYVKLIFNFKVIIILIIFSIISNFIVIFQNKKYKSLYTNNQLISGEAVVIGEKQEKEYNNIYKIKYNKTYVYLKIDKKSTIELNYGDKIKFSGSFIEPKENKNTGGFNYKNYLKTLKIYGTIKVNKIEILEKEKQNFILKYAHLISKKIKEKVNLNLDKEKADILIGILIGDTEEIEEELKENFRISNISHVLAVSGMHVTYIIIGINLLFKTKLGKRKLNFIIIIVLIFYMFITGFSASIVRAAIMAILIIGSKIMYRKNDVWNSIAISLFCILIYNPFLITSMGLQFSYLGTIGIIVFYKNVYVVLENIKITSKKLKYQINKKDTKAIEKIKNILAVTISAQLAIMPIMIYHTNLFSIYFFITNLLVSIIIGPIIILGIIAVIMSFIINPCAKVIFTIIKLLVDILIFISKISQLPFAKLYIPTPKIWQICLFYCIIIISKLVHNLYYQKKLNATQIRMRNLIALFKYKMYLNKKRSVMALVLLGVIILLVEFYPKNLKVNFIDVGQGDATFIVTPYNNTILIDGGGSESKNYNIGKNTVLPYILDKGYTKIDYIIISHFDQDHVRWIVIYYARNKSK